MLCGICSIATGDSSSIKKCLTPAREAAFSAFTRSICPEPSATSLRTSSLPVSNPVLVPLLLGLGVDELSASPPSIPQIKFLIRRLKLSEARALADFALSCESGEEILARSQSLAREAAPSLFENQGQIT